MSSIKRFFSNLKYEITVLILFVLSRIPSLGNDEFNTDVWKWKSRIYDFGSGIFNLDFELTIQKYHPGVTLMWLGSLGVKIYNFYYDIFRGHPPLDDNINTIFELNFVQKLVIVIAIGFTLASVFYVLRNLFGKKYAIPAIILISLEPFYIALTRVIHLEGLMSTFMIASFVWLYYYLFDTNHKSRMYVSALFAALSILTKSSSLYLVMFTGLMMLIWYWHNRGSLKTAVSLTFFDYTKWLLSVVILFVLFWPAMWVNPGEALRAVYRGIFTIGVERGHEQFFFGRLVDDPGVTFYLVVLGIRSSVYIVIGLIGALFIFKNIDKGKKNFIFYTLLFSILYLIEITIPSKKLDRYILPTIMGFGLVSTFFYHWACNKAGLFIKSRRTALLLCFIVLLPAAFTILRLHPDYFSFYNPLLGGLKRGIFILEPKWMIGQKEVTSYFEEIKTDRGYEDFAEGESIEEFAGAGGDDRKLVIGFQEKYYTQIWPFIRRTGAWAVISDLSDHAEIADFLVYPVWDDQSAGEDRFNLTKVESVKLRGVDIYNVYERTPLQVSL
ncbi:MAG: hypothetical protein UU72_C0002G0024 [candidate division WWE3 bacterium GW2011_GWB1_41_6]|uniref:Glycosyltransferase RgtA/B/C/D-like domain-containing protein n=4 Tax=Katanobacteria TaxID=422282 RepID=A0A0G0Z5Q7_UNCKA|nr:MAG: hypothetical protein UU72_C0002G0024 [candidate division WWE3 bacterium GW2011_GWB1_41_6]